MSDLLTDLSPFQTRIHTVQDNEENPSDNILSSVFPQYRKVEFSTPITIPSSYQFHKSGNVIKHIYKCDAKSIHDVVARMILEFDLPDIELAPQYHDTHRICYAPFLTHVMTTKAVMVGANGDNDSDKVQMQYRDTHILNTILQREFIGDQFEYERSIGNIPTLISEDLVKLPATTLAPQQLWTFAKYVNGYPVPLMYHRKHSIQFEYEFCLNLSKLLRMFEYVDGEWKSMDVPNLKLLIINGIQMDDQRVVSGDFLQLKPPRSTISYRTLTPICKEYYLKDVFNMRNTSGNTDMRIYYDDYIVIEKPNWNPESEKGRVKEIKLGKKDKDMASPCKTLYWMAENIRSRDKNLRCNYTDNVNSITLGKCPIAHNKIVYRKTEILNASREVMNSLNDTGSRPRVEGIVAYACSGTTHQDKLESGWVFGSGDILTISSIKNDSLSVAEEVSSRSTVQSGTRTKSSGNGSYHVYVIKKITRCIVYKLVSEGDGDYISFHIE